MKKTPLHAVHTGLNAVIVSFSGWEMPLHYSGVTDEHKTVRSAVGLFDISHMGRFELSGKAAEAVLDRLTPGPVGKLPRWSAHYSMLLNEAGGILDDIYIYKRSKERFFIIVNAANRQKDFDWMLHHMPEDGAVLTDVSDDTALLALQGPRSQEVLAQIIPFSKNEIPLRHFAETEWLPAPGVRSYVCRTGYTGEHGYELVVPASAADKIWKALLLAGESAGIKPVGLGARDTLRLEKGYLLYGHDINEQTTPIQADLMRFVDMKKSFIGKEALITEAASGPVKKIIGFKLLSGGVPREGHTIYSGEKEIGRVTSGNLSLMLKQGIGLGYVDAKYADVGSDIFIDIRGKAIPSTIVQPPFYRRK